MSIRELYRWRTGEREHTLIGQRGAGEDAELFRTCENEYYEETDDGARTLRRELGGWIPLEGSAEEDLALEVLRLKEAHDLQEQRHQGECDVLRKEAEHWHWTAIQNSTDKVTIIAELEQQRDSLADRVLDLLSRNNRLEAVNRELAQAMEELQDKPKKRSESAEKAELPMNLLLSQEFKDAWAEYLEVRRERRWTTSQPWAERALRRLAQYPADIAARAVKESADQGYQGIFPEKALDAAQRELERHAPRGDQPTPPYLSRRGGA